MHPDPQQPAPQGAWPPPQPGPPAAYPPPGPGYVPQQYGYGGPPPGYPYPPPVALSPAGQPLASFGDRFLAYLIDALIMTGVGMVVACPIMLLGFYLPFVMIETDGSGTITGGGWSFGLFFLAYAVMFVLLMAVYYVYFVEYQLRKGQTVGKRSMNLKVVPVDPRAAMTRGVLGRRYLVQFVVGIFVPFFSWVDGLWQLGDKPYQQTLHDKAARTVVVKVVP